MPLGRTSEPNGRAVNSWLMTDRLFLVEDENYTIDYVDENGKPQRQSSGTPDKDAAKQLANKLQTTVMQRKRGLINPIQERIAVEARKPILEHLDDFQTFATSQGPH